MFMQHNVTPPPTFIHIPCRYLTCRQTAQTDKLSCNFICCERTSAVHVMSGRPNKALQQLLSIIWLGQNSSPHVPHSYYCLSQQSRNGSTPTISGYRWVGNNTSIIFYMIKMCHISILMTLWRDDVLMNFPIMHCKKHVQKQDVNTR